MRLLRSGRHSEFDQELSHEVERSYSRCRRTVRDGKLLILGDLTCRLIRTFWTFVSASTQRRTTRRSNVSQGGAVNVREQAERNGFSGGDALPLLFRCHCRGGWILRDAGRFWLATIQRMVATVTSSSRSAARFGAAVLLALGSLQDDDRLRRDLVRLEALANAAVHGTHRFGNVLNPTCSAHSRVHRASGYVPRSP